MVDSRGPILIVNTLIFGIIAFCFVTSRLGFRLYTRKTSASDWLLVAALASLAPLSLFHEKICRVLMSKPRIGAESFRNRSHHWPRMLLMQHVSYFTVARLSFKIKNANIYLQALRSGATANTSTTFQRRSAPRQCH